MVRIDKKKLYILMCALIGAVLTWIINHKFGYGAIVANGLVGVIAAVILPKDLAGIMYTSSFVGMSSKAVVPSMLVATLGGVIVGLVLLATTEIYAGIGGKGGTTAALATIITRTITSIFG